MDTLKYLQKGGRIGLVASTVGTLLKLKPIISCNEEGVYYTVAKIRGANQAKKKLADEIIEFCSTKPTWLAFGHGNAIEEMKKVKGMIQDQTKNARVLFEKQITASMAVHTGPGLVGVLAFVNP